MTDDAALPVHVVEIRHLEGPNLYFARPAVKVTLDLPGYQARDAGTLTDLASSLGMPRATPGRPHSDQRHRFLVRFVAHLLRTVAMGAGTRLGVRSRPGADQNRVVAAYPWRRSERARALATALGPVLGQLLDGDPSDEVIAHAVAQVQAAPAGRSPLAVRPRIPVASITGTNGKTSTTRLLAHIGMAAGIRTGWSSTEGVYIQGERVQEGDYSGPSGARQVLDDPTVALGILETARGGLLLKGMGVLRNDVSVVTNVSADHLGTQGVDTVDQLAEVKSIITRVTRRSGWAVLNGDDPRVRAMAAQVRAGIWMFSLDPDSPALREALASGGRGITVLDQDLVILRPDSDPDHLVPLTQVPITLAGLSGHNIANALAATAAALALGLPREAVVEGLRTFTPDQEHNPGRMNVFTVDLPTETSGGGDDSGEPSSGSSPAVSPRGTVILDLAHNEAGLEALLDVARGLAPPGARVHLCLGGVGDRSDEILIGMGELAGRRADRVHIAHKGKYLRGRTVEELEALFLEGLAAVGTVPTGSSPTEVDGVETIWQSMADGDVCAVMSHAERATTTQFLLDRGGRADRPADIRRKVVAARGEHELDHEFAAAAELDPSDRIQRLRELQIAHEPDPRLDYEVATALADGGEVGEAGAVLDQALSAGLREPYRFHAQLRRAAALRAEGELTRARQILAELSAQRPGSAAVAALKALTAFDAGQGRAALTELVAHTMAQAADPDDAVHRSTVLSEHGLNQQVLSQGEDV